MNYQNENTNGTSFNNVCTFLSCFDSHKYSMKRWLPGRRKHVQDFEQEECEGNENLCISRLNVFFCFESLVLLLQLKGHPNDCQEMRDVTFGLKTLAEFSLQQNAKLSTATEDISPSGAGFLFQVTVHPTLEGWEQSPLLSHQVKPFPLSANLSWAPWATSGTPLFPTPALQRAAESQEQPRHVLQQYIWKDDHCLENTSHSNLALAVLGKLLDIISSHWSSPQFTPSDQWVH